MEWLERTLATSTAHYLVVAGHYPIYSICEHGPTSGLVERVKPLLEQYKVTAYLNGHDHCMQHLVTVNEEGQAVRDGVDYHTIGSAAINDRRGPQGRGGWRRLTDKSLKFHSPGKQGGFATVTVAGGEPDALRRGWERVCTAAPCRGGTLTYPRGRQRRVCELKQQCSLTVFRPRSCCLRLRVLPPLSIECALRERH